MARLSPTQLISLSWRFSEKPTLPCLLFPSQNPTPRLSLSSNSRNRAFSSVSNFWPSQASLNSSSVTSTAEIVESASTLREICEGWKRLDMLYLQMYNGKLCPFYSQDAIAYFMLRFWEDPYIPTINIFSDKHSKVCCASTDCGAYEGTRHAIARMLAAKPLELELEQKSCTVMALLDGGMLKRHKSWLKAEPPTIVVATMGSLCQMLERKTFKLESMRVLVIDEVDFMFNSSKQVSSLRKLLISYSSSNNRQTVFASASIPQHRRFVYDCIQHKWTKSDVVHVHVNPIEPMPSRLHHRFVICSRDDRHQTLLSLLQSDVPESGIIFVGEQSEKSKKAGNAPSTTLLIDFLKTSCGSCDILLLEEDMNFNLRAASLSEARREQRGSCLLVSTDIAARGVDLPETTHIYNFDLPRTAVDYLHRAGRTGRKPFSDKKCTVTNIITSEERFVLQRFENELMFRCEQLFL